MKILYHFSNDESDVHLIEIKRTDLDGETDKSKLFYWLFLSSDENVQRLTFIDATATSRTFKEGFLSFDDNNNEAIFFKYDNRFDLKKIQTTTITNTLDDIIIHRINNFILMN